MIEITCPSGLRGNLRGMKVKDEELFTDRKLARTGATLAKLLDSCWLETLDFGPYPTADKLDWNKILSSDRTYALIQLRIASYGEDYEFRTTCGACGHHFGWGINLNKMDVIPVSEEGRRHVQSGESVPVALPDGREIRCRLLTGEDERFLASLDASEESKVLTYHLARRIVNIDNKTDWHSILELVEDMEAATADHLWDITDDLEGGVETTFDLECPGCRRLQQVILPFDPNFFSKRKRFARSRRKKSG